MEVGGGSKQTSMVILSCGSWAAQSCMQMKLKESENTLKMCVIISDVLLVSEVRGQSCLSWAKIKTFEKVAEDSASLHLKEILCTPWLLATHSSALEISWNFPHHISTWMLLRSLHKDTCTFPLL